MEASVQLTAAPFAFDLHRRLRFVAVVIVYVTTFWWTYKTYAVPLFDYFGLGHRFDLPQWCWILIFALAITPALWMPVRFQRPSQFILAIQYFVIYIPLLFVCFHSSRPQLPIGVAVQIALAAFASLTLIQAWLLAVPRIRVRRYPLPPAVFWTIFAAGLVGCLANLLLVLGGNFRLASIAEIYSVRFDAADTLADSGSVFAAYAFNWLLAFFLPFLFSWAFICRRWTYCVLAGLGYLVLFGVWGSKAALFGPVMLALILWTVFRHRDWVLSLIPLGFCALLAAPVLMPDGNALLEIGRDWYIQIVHERTFTASPLIIVQYMSFFETHPLTYGSHVSGVNQLITYPYSGDIPRMIGNYIYGGQMTANVNFWGQDGIAGFALPGILIVTPVYALLLWLLDSVAADFDPRFVTGALGLIATNLADTSMFTALVSGGLLLLLLALLVFPATAGGAEIARSRG